MAYINTSTAQTPTGALKPMLLNGTVFVTNTPLAANGTVTTSMAGGNAGGWIPVGNYMSLLYIIQADQIGTIGAVEYSTDGINVSATGTGRAYTTPNRLVQVALTLKDVYFRLTFTNGSTAQGAFYMECKMSTAFFQNTMSSVHLTTTVTNLASLCKSILESDDGSGVFGQIYRTANSLNVHVDNSSMTVSGTVAVSNLPATQAVSASALPLPTGASTSSNQTTEIALLTPPANATVTSVTTLATVVTVLAANTARKNVKFFSLTGTILIKEGTGASATSFTNRLTTNGIWEPNAPIYTGVYTAIGAGTLLITENT